MSYSFDQAGETLQYRLVSGKQNHTSPQFTNATPTHHVNPQWWHGSSPPSLGSASSLESHKIVASTDLVDNTFMPAPYSLQVSKVQKTTNAMHDILDWQSDSYSAIGYPDYSVQFNEQSEYRTQAPLLVPASSFSSDMQSYQAMNNPQHLQWHQDFNFQPGVDMSSMDYIFDGHPQISHVNSSDFSLLPPERLCQNTATEATPYNIQYGYSESTMGSTWMAVSTSNIIHPQLRCQDCKPQGSSDRKAQYYENNSALQAHKWSAHNDPSCWEPQTCLWQGCATKAVFKKSKLWLNHVKNVHQKRYWCTIPGCDLRRRGRRETPFGTQTYLDNHIKGVHENPVYCSKPHCPSRIMSTRRAKLNRRDKLILHNKTWHGEVYCLVPSCPRSRIDESQKADNGFATQILLDEHVLTAHEGGGT